MHHSTLLTSRAAASMCCLVIGLVVLPAVTARADCKPVIAAYAKADASKRYAIYEVDSMAQAPAGEPMSITIGDTMYVENLVKKGNFNFEKDGYTKRGAAPGVEAKALQADEQHGKVKCGALGERKVGAEAALGYHVGSANSGSGFDPTAYDIWVSRATGLPLWHGSDSENGGFRWVYGNQVNAPAAGKIRN